MAVDAGRTRVAYGEGRDALVDAAIRLVARDGLGKLTYRSLTAEAGVSQGSLRHHFASLVGVLEAALQRCLQVSYTYLSRPSGSLEDLFVHLVDSMREHPEIPAFQTEVFVGARRRPELRQVILTHQEAYRHAVRAALDGSIVPPERDLVEVLVAMAEGIVYQRVIFGEGYQSVTEHQIAGSRRVLAALQSSYAAAIARG